MKVSFLSEASEKPHLLKIELNFSFRVDYTSDLITELKKINRIPETRIDIPETHVGKY